MQKFNQHISRPVLFAILIPIVFVLGACSFSSSVVSKSTVSTATTAATAVPATATAVPGGTTCQQVFTNGTANPALGASFQDVTLPTSTFGTDLTKTGGGGDGQFTISSTNLCTPTSSTTDISQYFVRTLITSNGWFQSHSFPSDGSYQDACPNGAHCFAKDTRYIELFSVQNNTDLITYSMQFAVSPAAPTCPNGPFLSGYYYKVTTYYYPSGSSTPVNFDVPLPPLTLEQPNDASGGQRGFDLCSAGSTAMVTAFIQTHLTALHWTLTSSSGANQSWTTPDGKLAVNFIFISGQNWTIYWRAGLPGM